MDLFPIAVSSSAGVPAILTAIGGVCVSLFTVYKNAKRQDKATQDNTDLINDLKDQTVQLTNQVIELKAQNAALSTELGILKGIQAQTQAAMVTNLAAQAKTQAEVDVINEPQSSKKSKKKKK